MVEEECDMRVGSAERLTLDVGGALDAAFARARHSGIRPRVMFDRAIRTERRITVHFSVRKKKRKGEIRTRVFPVGMVERIQHAPGCVEYLDPVALPLRVKKQLIQAAQASVWEWARGHAGMVAIGITTRKQDGKLIIMRVDEPQSSPSYGILCDFPPQMNAWMLEVACHATTTRKILEHCLEDILPAEPQLNPEDVSPDVVLHSFDSEARLGQILIHASNASACQRLANQVWGRLLPLVARSQ